MTFLSLTNRLIEKCSNVFGEQVIYYPKDSASKIFKGIFNEKSEYFDSESGFQIVSGKPNLGVAKILFSDDSKPSIDDTLIVRGLIFKVVNVDDDGESAYKLSLHQKELSPSNDIYDWIYIDDLHPNYYFYGGVSLLLNTSWKINRYSKINLNQLSYAANENNSGYSSLTSAWNDRSTLIYT